MFGTKKIAELESELKWARQRIDTAEAVAAKKQTDDYENRSWVEQGKGTGVETLQISSGQLLRLQDGRMFFLPAMQMTSYYGATGSGYCAPTSQQIVPLG